MCDRASRARPRSPRWPDTDRPDRARDSRPHPGAARDPDRCRRRASVRSGAGCSWDRSSANVGRARAPRLSGPDDEAARLRARPRATSEETRWRASAPAAAPRPADPSRAKRRASWRVAAVARRSKPLRGLEMRTRVATAARADQRQAEVVARLEVGRVARVCVLEPADRARRRVRAGVGPCQRNREPSSGFQEREAVRVRARDPRDTPTSPRAAGPPAHRPVRPRERRPPTSVRIARSAGSAAGRDARPMRVCDRTCSRCGSEPPFRLRPAART